MAEAKRERPVSHVDCDHWGDDGAAGFFECAKQRCGHLPGGGVQCGWQCEQRRGDADRGGPGRARNTGHHGGDGEFYPCDDTSDSRRQFGGRWGDATADPERSGGHGVPLECAIHGHRTGATAVVEGWRGLGGSDDIGAGTADVGRRWEAGRVVSGAPDECGRPWSRRDGCGRAADDSGSAAVVGGTAEGSLGAVGWHGEPAAGSVRHSELAGVAQEWGGSECGEWIAIQREREQPDDHWLAG